MVEWMWNSWRKDGSIINKVIMNNCKWMNKQMNEWTKEKNEWMNEWINEWMSWLMDR